MSNLYESIRKYKCGYIEEILNILDMFDPLLNKFQRNSCYEDMKSELSLFMFNLIDNFPLEKDCFKEDKFIINYIYKALKNKFIQVNKLHQKIKSCESNIDIVALNNCDYSNLLSFVIFEDIIKDLTQNEKNIIRKIYLDRLRESEISRELNISRQAVNKTHLRALEKLKKLIN
ncbi:sigma-70 family RNA polymerase sigma factor [Paraclostridium sordellii]|uniref:RNA polymerase sigma factor TcsR n=1 Tax=Paraclostridium sordellii TaxID=1505 RepID=TCSR2_PARSO|nr:sigma-70 family RNA polymerase sigma factor [Paeniclostridium sordellii]P0DUB5.1 RecName: Full=RNA polymerase sigma factor TcsR [Paeniclostridium sordellii]AHB59890.1 sigma factor [Paeniclostridium sordellii]AUO31607.1 hypothetical protein [Paeniclostridium sordellii]AUO31701.1 hypothetical protein [Paeniclostridium sordellii]EPZ61076.1 RNA polymerase sigma factor, sigma-70 family protein [[Clostridium] sordellii VPI 9048] [Paeniclostridium sordellii VPI 9048]CEK40048.1 Alternative RNA pol